MAVVRVGEMRWKRLMEMKRGRGGWLSGCLRGKERYETWRYDSK